MNNKSILVSLVLIASAFGADNRLGGVSFDTSTKIAAPTNIAFQAITSNIPNVLNVKAPPWFAHGNGTSSDRIVISNAVVHAIATGKTLYFPEGEYILDVPSDIAGGILELTSFDKLKIQGAGIDKTILKVGNDAERYYGIFHFSAAGTYRNFEVSDLTIDGNSGNSGLSVSDALLGTNPTATDPEDNYRIPFYFKGNVYDVLFERVKFKSIAAINCVAFTITTGDKATFRDCIFTDIGRTDGGENDHTSLYLPIDNATVENCRFYGRAENIGGLKAAFETHGNNALIKNIYVNTYERGGWVTAARSGARTGNNQIVRDSYFINVKIGLIVYAENLSSTSYHDVVMEDVQILNNVIDINRDAFVYPTIASAVKSFGIGLSSGDRAGITRLKVNGNHISFRGWTSDLHTSWDDFPAGIFYYVPSAVQSTAEFSEWEICDNVITDSHGPGIYINLIGKKFKINGNRVYNAGKDPDTTVRTGIYTTGTLDYSQMNGNHVIDLGSPSTMNSGIFLGTSSSIESEAMDNYVRVGTTSFTPITSTAASDAAAWRISAAYRGSSLPTPRVRFGSRIVLENSGAIYEQRLAPSGQQWQRVDDALTSATDAATTLTMASSPNYRLSAPLTANRTVTLPSSNVPVGYTMRFTRTSASTGAFNWDIGGLRNLATSEWCDAMYNGSAWFVTASGLVTSTTATTADEDSYRYNNGLLVDGTATDALTGTSGINLGTNDFSIVVTMRSQKWQPLIGSDGLIFETHSTGNNRVYIEKVDTSDSFDINFVDGAGAVTTKTLAPLNTLTDGEIKTIIITCDRNGLATIWVNGVQGGTSDISALSSIDIGSGNANVWTAFNNIQATFFNFAVYGRVLLEADVDALRNAPTLHKDQWGSTTVDYTSNFSVGVDSFISGDGANITLTGNTDGINSQDNWLKVERTTGTGRSDVSRVMTAGRGGKSQKMFVRIFNHASSTITHFKLNYNGVGGQSPTATAIAAGAEGLLEVEWTGRRASGESFTVAPCNSAGALNSSIATGNIYYIKDVNIWMSGAILDLDLQNFSPSVSTRIFDLANNNHGTILTTENHNLVRRIPQLFVDEVFVANEAYDATAWNGNLEVPTKDAIRDKIEALGASGVDDTAFASSWNGATTTSPSQNAAYDYLHTFDTDDDGKVNVLDLTAGITKTDGSGVVSVATEGSDYLDGNRISDTGFGVGWNGDVNHAPSKNAVYDLFNGLELTFNANQFDVDSDGHNVIKDGALVTNLVSSSTLKFGTTSSFPMFKRNLTDIQLRLADDSDYTSFFALDLNASGDVLLEDTGSIIWEGFSTLSVPTIGIFHFDVPSSADTIIALVVGDSVGEQFVLHFDPGTEVFQVMNKAQDGNLDFKARNIEATGTLTVAGEVYGAGWNGDSTVPTKDAIYDQIETIPAALVSDTAYAGSWNGVTGVAPSKNAVYDKLEAMSTLVYEFALSDETTAITTGTAKVTWRAPHAMTITDVRASLSTASSSGDPTVDINDSGTTILSTKLSIDANEKTSTTAASAAVISDTAIADDAEVTFDIDTAGTGAKGLKVKIYYTR
jgi:hypothetical protein